MHCKFPPATRDGRGEGGCEQDDRQRKTASQNESMRGERRKTNQEDFIQINSTNKTAT